MCIISISSGWGKVTKYFILTHNFMMSDNMRQYHSFYTIWVDTYIGQRFWSGAYCSRGQRPLWCRLWSETRNPCSFPGRWWPCMFRWCWCPWRWWCPPSCGRWPRRGWFLRAAGSWPACPMSASRLSSSDPVQRNSEGHRQGLEGRVREGIY